MTTIDGVITNDMDFKHLDTTKNIVIAPKDEFGNSVQLNASHTWTAKVSDGDNYVGDYQVTLESTSIVVNSADFTNLPAGHYHLEIWEEWIDSNSKKQRSIYPSPQRTIDFTIYQNVTDLAEKEIKTIGFQDVVDQAVMNIGMNYVFKVNTIEPDQTATVVQAAADGKNYVTFNIPRGAKGDKGDPGVPGDPGERGLPGNDGLTPHIDAKTGHWMLGSLDTGVTAKGDKGDTGTVDNAGLTNAPAFQALQTQVNNSAIGTNLLEGSRGPFTPNSNPINYDNGLYTNAIVYLEEGTTYTISASSNGNFTDDHEPNTESDNIVLWLTNVKLDNTDPKFSTIVSSQTTGTTGTTFTWHQPSVYGAIRVNAYHKNPTMHVENIKIEKGSVATDWCPNPTEILTQSDYAKIKAAIVALGGSLS